jgi:hypothetical protein
VERPQAPSLERTPEIVGREQWRLAEDHRELEQL